MSAFGPAGSEMVILLWPISVICNGALLPDLDFLFLQDFRNLGFVHIVPLWLDLQGPNSWEAHPNPLHQGDNVDSKATVLLLCLNLHAEAKSRT